jgi:hypothetical protein
MASDTQIMIALNRLPNNIVIFDTNTNQFTEANVDTNVIGSNIILMGNNIYLVGGGERGSNKIYKYNPQSIPAWTLDTKAVLLAPRSLSGLVTVDVGFFANGYLPSKCTEKL